MRKAIAKAVVLWLLYCLVPHMVLGQTRTITGTVTTQDGKALQGVTVTVRGTSTATATGSTGNYSIRASTGDVLEFTFIGYETVSVTIGTGNVVNVTMVEGVGKQEEEVVVTTEFGMKRIGRAVGSSVQQIDGATIAESGRDAFITALQGRVPGLNVTSTSGAPGASTTVILRNITSISGNNQPLYVVDGVPMNNSTFDPIGMAGAEVYSVRNQDYASRGNDFNPEDIESITVLKGAAAAALYGSDASNGAIIITTKKGRVSRGRVSYSNFFRWDKAYGYPDMQTKYANGAYGTTNYYYTSQYGNLFTDNVKLYDNIAAVLQTGFSHRHNVSVEAGSEKATIRAGFSYLNQEGVVKTTDFDRANISLSGQATITQWLKFEGSMQYTKTENHKVLRGTDGPLYRAMLWPQADNMLEYLASDGLHMKYPSYYIDRDLLNPLFAMYKNKNYDRSNRFLTNVALTLTPIKNTFLRGQIGWDVGMQTFETSWHPYYAANNSRGDGGRYDLVHSNFSDPTINIIAGYNNKFLDNKLSFGAQVGYHQQENGVIRQATSGTRFIIPDFQSINNTDPLTIVSSQRNTKRRIQAISAQFEFGYNNMAFITLRGRNDWSSTLPINNNRYFYPAIEGSLILTDLLKIESDVVNFIKLRGSIARVGKDAGPLEIYPQLEPTNLSGGGFKYGFTGPNPNLKPEMTTAREVGFDARLFNNRVNAIFTVFGTRHEDQIVKSFRLSYATGFVLNTMNVGTFKTWGWEGLINADIIKTGSFTWNLGVNASRGRSKVLYLPENVTEYYNPYTWNSGNIRNGISVGNPITTISGRAYARNKNGDILIDPSTGIPIVSDEWSILGDREPKLRFGITTGLQYNNWRLSGVFAGRYKATVVNGTKRSMMERGTSWESVALREGPPVVFKGVLRDGKENSDNPTINNISVNYNLYSSSIFAGGDEDWIEKDVNYLRLQELRLSYSLPKKFLSKTKIISGLDFFVVGNDLFTLTNYSGIDAVGNTVSAAAGGTGGEGYDVWSLPNPRGITIGLNLTLN